MMKKDIFIDITSLLDVILIILFAAMLHMNNTSIQAEKEVQDMSNEMESLQEDLKSAEKDNLMLEEASEVLAAENESLLLEVETLTDRLDFVNHSINIEDLYKYEVVFNKFTFIDLYYEDTEETFYINDENTGIYLTSDDWYDYTLRSNKVSQISAAMEDYIDSIKGGYSFILITYKHTDKVYRYVSQLALASIDYLQSQYKDNTIFETEYIIFEE